MNTPGHGVANATAPIEGEVAVVAMCSAAPATPPKLSTGDAVVDVRIGDAECVPRLVARKLRLQFPDAIYHVINRGMVSGEVNSASAP